LNVIGELALKYAITGPSGGLGPLDGLEPLGGLVFKDGLRLLGGLGPLASSKPRFRDLIEELLGLTILCILKGDLGVPNEPPM